MNTPKTPYEQGYEDALKRRPKANPFQKDSWPYFEYQVGYGDGRESLDDVSKRFDAAAKGDA
jgi:hypothetical protein